MRDIYTVNAAPKTQIFYEHLGGNLDTRTGVRLQDQTGAAVEERQVGGAGAAIDLSQGGTYTLTINSLREGVTGTYSFRLHGP